MAKHAVSGPGQHGPDGAILHLPARCPLCNLVHEACKAAGAQGPGSGKKLARQMPLIGSPFVVDVYKTCLLQ